MTTTKTATTKTATTTTLPQYRTAVTHKHQHKTCTNNQPHQYPDPLPPRQARRLGGGPLRSLPSHGELRRDRDGGGLRLREDDHAGGRRGQYSGKYWSTAVTILKDSLIVGFAALTFTQP